MIGVLGSSVLSDAGGVKSKPLGRDDDVQYSQWGEGAWYDAHGSTIRDAQKCSGMMGKVTIRYDTSIREENTRRS